MFRRALAALAVLTAPLLMLSPTSAQAATRTGGGYWMMTADGQVHNFGGAAPLGSPMSIDGRVKITPTPRGDGYWVLRDRKSTRLNSSHTVISYAVFCLKKKIYQWRSVIVNPDITTLNISYCIIK